MRLPRLQRCFVDFGEERRLAPLSLGNNAPIQRITRRRLLQSAEFFEFAFEEVGGRGDARGAHEIREPRRIDHPAPSREGVGFVVFDRAPIRQRKGEHFLAERRPGSELPWRPEKA